MNKKGFTTIELIVSFVLTSIVVIFLFNLIFSLKDLYTNSVIKTELLNKQTIITQRINKVLESSTVRALYRCGDNCAIFAFTDGTSKKLEIKKNDGTFSFGDYKTAIAKNSVFGDIIMKSYNLNGIIDGKNDSYLEIKIPIAHSLLANEDYGINTIYQYDVDTTSISNFDNTSASGDTEVLLKGLGTMIISSEDNFIDPGYQLKYSDDQIVDDSLEVKIIGKVGSEPGTYTLNYIYEEAGIEISRATRTVIKIKEVTNYFTPGAYEKYIVPTNGYYRIELWGAQGGCNNQVGGRGAYTKGDIYLKENEELYVYVGGGGATSAGGWNGGGTASNDSNYHNRGGGGATDVRTVATSALNVWNEAESLQSRIMVAAGGGGSGSTNPGGAGGGLNGYLGTGSSTAGSQIAGGSGSTYQGGFGYGANGYNLASGGGSGWYGGGQNTHCYACGAAGGSSYISGHSGCLPYSSDGTFYGESISSTNKFFTSTKMIDGNGYEWTTVKGSSVVNMPNHDNTSTMVGNTGNGYAKITFLEAITVSDNQLATQKIEITKNKAYIFTGRYQIFKVPFAGQYQIELWGAQGGSNGKAGGFGGYTSGIISLNQNDQLYVYVGGGGATSAGGWNGGGTASNDSNYHNRGGGGATDVRTVVTSTLNNWNEAESLRSRIMVAGGGGGSGSTNPGGSSGGLNGYLGTRASTAGSQIAGGSGSTYQGGFGYGANGYNLASGGGSGWYGGGQNTYCYACGAAGGSSYISGHDGCIGVNADGTKKADAYTSIDDSISHTNYTFTSTKMIDGNGYEWTTEVGTTIIKMPDYLGEDNVLIGNSGNGYAKITYKGI